MGYASSSPPPRRSLIDTPTTTSRWTSGGTPDAVHVISSGIDPDGWTPVPEDTAATVDLASLEITRLDGWATQRIEESD